MCAYVTVWGIRFECVQYIKKWTYYMSALEALFVVLGPEGADLCVG